MMKRTGILAIAILGIFLFSSGISMVAAEPKGWEPDPEDVPGFEHYLGISFTSDDDPILTGVTSVRIDFWTKGDNLLFVSITIENETNIFEQPAPEALVTAIEDATEGTGFTIEIETLWDLISVGLPAIASLDSSLKTKKLDVEDYPYLDKGIALYSSELTLVVAEDQELAIIAMNLPIEAKPDSEAELQAAANAAIAAINALIAEIMAVAAISMTAEPELNSDVISVVDSLSFKFGDNGPENSNIPGFPLLIMGIISAIGIGVLIKKRK